MTLFVGALEMELHVPDSGSLKEKRAVVKHLVDTARRRYGVAASEVDHQELWQRVGVAFAAVSSSATHVEDVLDAVERFVWSNPEFTVLGARRHWLEPDS
ncbi:MAG TPA: DUF503 domain-containing protein [Acidimicrobiales bacterium]|nr:DUF503 domain-containing protein [Acidimicrobiales bacterium]